MKRKLPRTQKALDAMLQSEYWRGMNNGHEEAKRAAVSADADMKRKRELARLEALSAATKLASAMGQSIGELARVMQSEANQL